MTAADAFWTAAAATAAAPLPPRTAALDARLAAVATAAAAAHPDLALAPAAFLAYLGRRFPGFPGGDLADFLDAIDPGELYLVAACAAGDPSAQRRFDASYLPEVAAGARRLACSADQLDELRQQVRILLYTVGPDGAPRLAGLTARGDLRALLRLMALRAGLSLRRAGARTTTTDDDRLFDLAGDDASPALAFAREEHRQIFRAALEHALAQLEPRHRTVLRLHALDGVTLAKLATLFQVDRATISRWFAQARHDLLAATRRRLASEHGIAADRLDSFLDVIRSRFDVSMQRLLAG